MRTAGFRARRNSATPLKVPPVPTEQMKPSTAPLVCSQISRPVVSRCTTRLAVLSNWFAHSTPFGSRSARSAARRPETLT